jgi:hypothetical protein
MPNLSLLRSFKRSTLWIRYTTHWHLHLESGFVVTMTYIHADRQ